VIKIERAGEGDITRGQLRDIPGVDSLYFTMLNHNKRSITVDAKNPKGKEILERLADWTPPPAIGAMPEEVTDPVLNMLWGITTERVHAWAESQDGGPELSGAAAAPGVVEGIARVLRGDGAEGVERRVEPLHAREDGLDHLDRRDLLRADLPGQRQRVGLDRTVTQSRPPDAWGCSGADYRRARPAMDGSLRDVADSTRRLPCATLTP